MRNIPFTFFLSWLEFKIRGIFPTLVDSILQYAEDADLGIRGDERFPQQPSNAFSILVLAPLSKEVEATLVDPNTYKNKTFHGKNKFKVFPPRNPSFGSYSRKLPLYLPLKLIQVP